MDPLSLWERVGVRAREAPPMPDAPLSPTLSPKGRGGRAAVMLLLAALPSFAEAQTAAPGGLPLLIGQGTGGTSYSVPIQTLLFFTALSFLPAVLQIGRAHV